VRKLLSLRKAVLAAPLGARGGRLSHERLLTFAEKGSVRFFADDDDGSFELSYDAHLIAVEYAGDPLKLLWTVCRWLAAECPGVPPDTVRFHVDILDEGGADVSVLVTITEAIREIPGGVAAVPDPDLGDFGAFLGMDGNG
jgi:hypothetical protein